MNYIETLGKKAKCAEPFIASAQTDTKNAALVSIAGRFDIQYSAYY